MDKRRVVITGMGVMAPTGVGCQAFWEATKSGISGIGSIELFDTSDFSVKLGAEVKKFNPMDYMDKKESRRMDRFSQLAMAAASLAVEDAGIDFSTLDATKIGVLVGSGIGGLGTLETEVLRLKEKGPSRVAPLLVPMMIPNMASGNIAIRYGLKGMCTCAVTACATGTNSIGDAYRLVRDGYADVMVCGGAEAPITPLSLAGFSTLGAMTERTDPTRASIPFDKERDGFVVGEGAGVLIIEALEHAEKRNACIRGEIKGYGSTCDAYHMTAPSPTGDGATECMRLAFADQGVNPCEVDYINAHGTSTPPNDKVETMAIKNLLGEKAYKIAVSSTKSMTGHMLGAAGAAEAVICVMAVREGFVPPTIGYRVPDEECDLDYVPNVGRKTEVRYALSNSFGFGGHNASLLFGKFEG